MATTPDRDPRALPPGDQALELTRPQGRPLPMAPEPPHLYGYMAEAETHFWDYWRVVRRRRWAIFTCFMVAAIGGILWVFTQQPVYTSTATLRIEKEEPRIVKFEEVVKEDSQQDYYQTQYRILQSRSLANRVIGLLQLDQHAEFQRPEGGSGWWQRAEVATRERLVQWIAMPPPRAPETAEEAPQASPLTQNFLDRLSVEPIRSSRLVKVSFDSHQPELAARVANTLAEAFIAQQLDQKVEATRYASQFLAKQLDDSRGKLGEAEGRLNEFLKANDILFVTAEKNLQPQDLATQQLTLLSDALLKARGERIARQSLVAGASSTRDAQSLPAVLQSPLIGQLKQQLGELEAEHKKLGQVFKPEYPRMQQITHKIAEARRTLRTEVDRAVQALHAEYEAAARNERELEAALTQQRQLARGMSESMAQYNLLRREVDTNRDLYSALLGRLRETQISAALFTSNISIVDRAEVPPNPARPRRAQSLFVACVLGLMGGLGLAFLLEYLDTNIKDAREVENVLRVPILGMVPGWDGPRRLPALTADEPRFAMVAHSEIASVYAESFRNLRTSLLYSTPDHPPKTIMVTSLQPEDGKTSTVTNLATTLAQLGAGEVLVVDADMRRPNLHEILGVPQAPGLSTFLTGQASLDQVIVPTRVPNLSMIPAGRSPLNPAELLASERLGQSLETLGRRFAHIVLDTGPIFGVSDALILAARVEGVVLVLRQGRAGRDVAQRAIRNLLSVRSRLLGVILNDVDVQGHGYYGYYGPYGYGTRPEQS